MIDTVFFCFIFEPLRVPLHSAEPLPYWVGKLHEQHIQPLMVVGN